MSSLPLQMPAEGFLAGECWKGFWCIHLKCISHGSLPARGMFRRQCALDNELFRRHNSFWGSQGCLLLVLNSSWWNLALNLLMVTCGVPGQWAAAGMKGMLHFRAMEILGLVMGNGDVAEWRLVQVGHQRQMKSKDNKDPPKFTLSFQPTPTPQNMSVSFHSFWVTSHKTLLIILGLAVSALRGWSRWRDPQLWGSRVGENKPICFLEGWSEALEEIWLISCLSQRLDKSQETLDHPLLDCPGMGALYLCPTDCPQPSPNTQNAFRAFSSWFPKAGLLFGYLFVLPLQLSCQDATKKLVWMDTKCISCVCSGSLKGFLLDWTICSPVSAQGQRWPSLEGESSLPPGSPHHPCRYLGGWDTSLGQGHPGWVRKGHSPLLLHPHDVRDSTDTSQSKPDASWQVLEGRGSIPKEKEEKLSPSHLWAKL